MPRQEKRLIPRRQPDDPAMLENGRVFESSWIRALALLSHAMRDQLHDNEAHSLMFAALQEVKREYFATYPASAGSIERELERRAKK